MKRVVLFLVLLLTISSEPLTNDRLYADDQCLASAIYYEARGESIRGKRAVLDVIENRMADTGSTACQVVLSRSQFSWSYYRPIKKYTKEMEELLTEVKNSDKVLINEKYKWFFGRFITPFWARNMDCTRIGNHKFCKEK